VGRAVGGGALVVDVGAGGQGEEAVGEALGDPKLTAGVGGELGAEGAAVGRRGGAEVHGDVEDGAEGASSTATTASRTI
jgi:hypothetical protein